MKNNIALPLIATVILSAIIGIAGTHFHQVQQMVQNGPQSIPSNIDSPSGDILATQPTTDIVASIPSSRLPVLKKREPSITPPAVIGSGETPREDALLKILADQTQMLAAMRTEQRHLREQLSETNRDMDELTFRVDSHSSTFRPLRVDGSHPRALITTPTSLPNTVLDNGDLLPAKR